MNKFAKILWLVCGLSFVVLVIIRYILGGWTTDWLFVPLGLSLVSFIAAFIVDYKFYLEFLTLKTTKNGMNMGVMIVLVIAFMVAINFFGKRYSESWDLSEEKFNSLSDQSLKVMANLDEELVFVGFYRGGEHQNYKQMVSQSFAVYKDKSDKVKLRFVNSLVEIDEAQKHLSNIQDKSKFILLAAYKGKKIRVEEPFNESNITSAMIKVTRDRRKNVYFLVGHGEKDINSEDSEGLSNFKQRLENSYYMVKELNLLAAQAIPTDADIIAIVGPKEQILEGERKLLKGFLEKGGRLFVAADPGQKHDLALLTKTIGVEYRNNYILDLGLSKMLGGGPTSVLGMEFDNSSDITNKFIGRRSFTIFDTVSEVAKEPNHPEDFKVTELIKSSGGSFIVNELKNVRKSDIKSQKPHSFAVVSEGRLQKPGDKDSKEGNDFAAVVFGDSDFLSQRNIIQGLNIDLALNAIAYLAKEADLISIPPKSMKKRTLVLSSVHYNIIVILGILLPIFLFIVSGTIWFRRRSA